MREQNINVPDDFRGLIYEPFSEQEVIVLFFMIQPYLRLELCFDEIRTDFPDCIAWRRTKKGWKTLRVEFEHLSHNFLEHGHDVSKCDLIICWEHNWPNCPLEIIELKKEIKKIDKNVILLNKPKYTQIVWTKEKFFEYVEKEHPNLREIFKMIFSTVEDRGIYILEGKGAKIPTFSFKIPATDFKAVVIIQGDGKIWVDFSKLSVPEKKEFSAKLKNKLKLTFDEKKAWPIIGCLGTDIPKNRIETLLKILLEK